MSRPFNIRIFVAEGIPDGLRLVEKSNWVGLGIICPRGRYPTVKIRDEFENSGVYILTGYEGDDERPTIYVGEAETIRARLDSHHAEKAFWQQAIVFTTKGDPLNKAEVQYLEASLVDIAHRYKRCRLENKNKPNFPGMSEPDRAQVEGYLEEMLSLLPVIGLTAFTAPQSESSSNQLFYLKAKGSKATGYPTSNGFAVLKGSVARKDTLPSMDLYMKVRGELLEDGVIAGDDKGLIFQVDHEFSSPSQAATVITGRSSNGREEWKDAKGVSLKEHQAREASI